MSEPEDLPAAERQTVAPQAAGRTGSMSLLNALMSRLADLGTSDASGSGRGTPGGSHRYKSAGLLIF